MTIKDVLPAVKALRVGAELRQLRQDAGKTLAQVASSLGWDAARLSRIERAKSPYSTADLAKLLDLYGVVGDERRDMLALNKEGRRPAWWRDYSDYMTPVATQYTALEAEAALLIEYQADVPPALLQTKAYRRNILENSASGLSADGVEAFIEIHAFRVERLYGEPKLHVRAVVGEMVRMIDTGGVAVMRDQFAHLIECSRLPNVEIRVVPFSSGRRGVLASGASILEFPDMGDPNVAFVETMADFIAQESPRSVRRTRQLVERAEQVALPPDESVELIKTWMK